MKRVVWFCIAVSFTAQVFAQVRLEPIQGHGLPKYTIVMTRDDGPSIVTVLIAWYLAQKNIPATFFFTGWGFEGAPPCDPRSWICNDPGNSPGNMPRSILEQVVALGHTVGNHTEDHLAPLTQLTPEEIIYQFELLQRQLDFWQLDGFAPFRTPGFWWSGYVAQVLQSDPYLSKMTGPFESNLPMLLVEDGTVTGLLLGGDYDCEREGLTPEVCGDAFIEAIRDYNESTGEGVLLLLHDRWEEMQDPWYPFRLCVYIVESLPEFRWGTLEEIPGIYEPRLHVQRVAPAPGRPVIGRIPTPILPPVRKN